MPSRVIDSTHAEAPVHLSLPALQGARQRLRIMPQLGGSIASWDWQRGEQWLPLLRPWDGHSQDLISTACFPLLPWSNRITGGGFHHDERFHAVAPNRRGERYPIHGDAWLQPWTVSAHSDERMVLELDSLHHDGNPYAYHARQVFALREHCLEIELRVCNTGQHSLPFGLGLHPYFLHDAQTRLQFRSRGVWLCGHDSIPTRFTRTLPSGWDYNRPAPLAGELVDNCYEGWDGLALIEDPTRSLRLQMHTTERSGYCLLYRPPGRDYFCLEPVTHPVDAFHLPHQPGLVTLAPGQDMVLLTRFSVNDL